MRTGTAVAGGRADRARGLAAQQPGGAAGVVDGDDHRAGGSVAPVGEAHARAPARRARRPRPGVR